MEAPVGERFRPGRSPQGHPGAPRPPRIPRSTFPRHDARPVLGGELRGRRVVNDVIFGRWVRGPLIGSRQSKESSRAWSSIAKRVGYRFRVRNQDGTYTVGTAGVPRRARRSHLPGCGIMCSGYRPGRAADPVNAGSAARGQHRRWSSPVSREYSAVYARKPRDRREPSRSMPIAIFSCKRARAKTFILLALLATPSRREPSIRSFTSVSARGTATSGNGRPADFSPMDSNRRLNDLAWLMIIVFGQHGNPRCLLESIGMPADVNAAMGADLGYPTRAAQRVDHVRGVRSRASRSRPSISA